MPLPVNCIWEGNLSWEDTSIPDARKHRVRAPFCLKL